MLGSGQLGSINAQLGAVGSILLGLLTNDARIISIVGAYLTMIAVTGAYQPSIGVIGDVE